MQAIGSARKGSGRSAAAVFKDSVETYSSNFYLDPPYSAVTNLQDFETMALERLKVLRIVESAGLSTNKFSEAYTEVLLKNLSKELRQRYIRSSGGSPEETERDRERDVLSHFILQMVYCRSEVSCFVVGRDFVDATVGKGGAGAISLLLHRDRLSSG